MQGYPALKPTRKTGDEPLHRDSQKLGLTLLDFWRWSASDLVSNATRGLFAEYIVSSALGLHDVVRAEWDSFDILLKPGGLKIEVKSASYLQSWFHQKRSVIRFGIQPTKCWDSSTNLYSSALKRQADIYVFCLLAHTDKATLEPLNVAQWEFYVVQASVLDKEFRAQKSVSLAKLRRLGFSPVSFEALSSCIRQYA